ncbi:MAG: hypothetical protein ACFHWZ_02625 [Phycisphaerales bacterium]
MLGKTEQGREAFGPLFGPVSFEVTTRIERDDSARFTGHIQVEV